MSDILAQVERYYTGRIVEHGPTARGVDWNSPESQQLRFEQLLGVVPAAVPFSLVDYGCGYGALLDWIRERDLPCAYAGYDVAAAMVERASETHPEAVFTAHRAAVAAADYALASGIFNVKQGVGVPVWEQYVRDTLDDLARLGTRGFSFNMLTSYSDRELMRSDLYYGEPSAYFDLCVERYSRHVSLRHDYGLYEFTIIVRRG